MRAVNYGKVFGVLALASSVAVACGGVNQGRVEIVDEEGGGDGGTDSNGESGGGNGGSGGSGGHAGKSPGTGGDTPGVVQGGEAGEVGRGGTAPLGDPPVVVSITPESGDDQAEPTDSVVIEFSEELDPSTVTSDSVLVYDGETPISGTLVYSDLTAEFTPDERLDLLGEYSVVVTTDVTDLDGTPLAEDFSSSFIVRDGKWTKELEVENTQGTLNRRLVSPVIDARGNVLMVWGQAKLGENAGSVFGRYYSPGLGFGDAFEIDVTTAACDDISVAMNGAGQALVVWSEKRGAGEEVWARRIDQGTLGAAPKRVDVAAVTVAVAGTTSAVSATGEAHAFWWFTDSASGGTKQNIVASHADAGKAWLTTPEIIYNYSDVLSPPGVAFDPAGNGFVFFAFESDTSDQVPSQVYARRYIATGKQWGNGVVVGSSDDVSLYQPPSVATDAKGGARALFTAGQDVKLVTFTKAGGFAAAAAIDTLDVAPSSVPQISSNGSRFLAGWYQSVSLNTNAYSALSDGGAFAAPELRSSGDFQVGYYGNAVSGLDRRGNGLLLFEQGNAQNTVDIVFGRLTAKNDAWVDGVAIDSVGDQYQDPRVAVAENGVAVAAWSYGIRLSATKLYVSTFE